MQRGGVPVAEMLLLKCVRNTAAWSDPITRHRIQRGDARALSRASRVTSIRPILARACSSTPGDPSERGVDAGEQRAPIARCGRKISQAEIKTTTCTTRLF